MDHLESDATATRLAGDVTLANVDGPDATERGATLPFDVYLTSARTAPSPIEISIDVFRSDGTRALSRQIPCGPSF